MLNLFSLALLVSAPVVLVVLWWRDVIRPGSFARAGRGRDLSAVPTLVWLAAAFMLVLAPALAGPVGALPAAWIGDRGSVRYEAITTWAAYAAVGAAIVFLFFLLRPRASPTAGLRGRWGDIPIGVGCFVLALPVIEAAGMASFWLAALVTGQKPPTIAHDTLKEIMNHPGNPWTWVLIAAVVLGTPIAEEVTFRVFLQSAVLRLTGRAWAAILVTAGLFAAVHLGSADALALPTLFVLGVAMGLAYERTRRLGVPIVMHAAFNAANIARVMVLAAGGG